MDSENSGYRRDDRPHLSCDEVTRALAAPSGTPSPAEVAAHLETCPRCASWAERARALDRLWEATRPPEPVEGAWDTLWAKVTEAADAPLARETIRLAPARRPRRYWAVAAGLVGVAAALTIAVLGPSHLGPSTASAEEFHFEAEAGNVLIVRIDDGKEVRVDQRAQSPISETDTILWDYALYNEIEALTVSAD
jgi:hypothetical protein